MVNALRVLEFQEERTGNLGGKERQNEDLLRPAVSFEFKTMTGAHFYKEQGCVKDYGEG